MYNDPYQEPIGEQTAEAMPPMEDLQTRSVAHTPLVNEEMISAAEIASLDIHGDKAHTAIFTIGKVKDFILWFLIVLEIALALRFFFRLIGANPDTLFAGFLYALTSIFLVPFNGIVGTSSLHSHQAFEWSTLIGMLVYCLIVYAVGRFLQILVSKPAIPE